MVDEKPMRKKVGGKKGGSNWKLSTLFLLSVIILWFVSFLYDSEKANEALEYSGKIAFQIAPILVLVLIFMALVNYLLRPYTVSRFVGKGSGAKGWIISAFAGVLSHGPIYAWYPLLGDLREKGMRHGLVAVFLYNRGVKIPLLPVMAHYFGLVFVGVLLVLMIIASIFEGLAIDFIMSR